MRDDVFFLNDTATTEIYTLSLHDALPISGGRGGGVGAGDGPAGLGDVRSRHPVVGGRGARRAGALRLRAGARRRAAAARDRKSTRLKLQSQSNLVCRLLLEKKKSSSQLPN